VRKCAFWHLCRARDRLADVGTMPETNTVVNGDYCGITTIAIAPNTLDSSAKVGMVVRGVPKTDAAFLLHMIEKRIRT
jgi:hypothetical protein